MNNKFFIMAKNAFAFTLAETLIVIGVIGIVSALTLPNLNSSTGEKEKVAKVKKIYQNLQDAFGRAEAVYGPYNDWFINDGNDEVKTAKRAGERITEFMKVSKTCGSGADTSGCFTNREALGTDCNKESIYKIITADGSSIGFYPAADNIIFVDIDGPTKGKFEGGHDVFLFEYNTDEHVVFPYGYTAKFSDLLNNIKPNGLRDMAATWIIRYDNADYLQFKDGNGTCKNGNVVTEANPTCK
ncbi:type II secretion system protein [bacterium]|nr:type II secretion system protein [bacterium]